MSEQNKQEAAELAKRARNQGRNAVKNTGRAVKVATEPVVEEGQEVIHRLEEVGEQAVKQSRRLQPIVLTDVALDFSVGFAAMAISVAAGIFSVQKFGTGIQRSRTLFGTKS